jgi:hypothetical protein
MTKSLKTAFLLTLGVLALATLLLSLSSSGRTYEWDLPKEATNWACVRIRDGAIFVAYVETDAAPRLKALSPSSGYRDRAAAYANYAMEKAYWARADFDQKRISQSGLEAQQELLNGLDPDSRDAQELKESIRAQRQADRKYWKKYKRERERVFLLQKRSERLELSRKASLICKSRSFAGFSLNVASSPREVVLRLPLAAFILLFGLAPALALFHRMRIRSRRKKENLCLTCGYNLTGNLSGTCPECGTQITAHRLIQEH